MECDLLLYGGKIVTETHSLPRGYVAITNGQIASIGRDWGEIKAFESLDVDGKIVVPGFIDMHTHGIDTVSFMESNEEEMEKGLLRYTEFGVTRVIASTISNTLEVITNRLKHLKKVKESRENGHILHGVHVEGPWLSSRCRGGHPLKYLRVPEKEEILSVLEEDGDAVVSVTFAPELPNTVWLTEELSRRCILPIIGHTDSSFEETERVILAGARHVTHMYDAAMGYKEDPQEALVMLPGMETAVLLHDEVSVELIGCPVHVPQPFFKFIDKVKPKGKKVVVTDSLVGTGLPEGTVFTSSDGRQVKVTRGVLRMIDEDPAINGNLTGSAVTMNVALQRLKEYAAISLEEALSWGTINPARTLGIDRITGSIAVGKAADLAVIDEDFNVYSTLVKGKILFEKRKP